MITPITKKYFIPLSFKNALEVLEVNCDYLKDCIDNPPGILMSPIARIIALVGILACWIARVPCRIYSTGGLKFVSDENTAVNTILKYIEKFMDEPALAAKMGATAAAWILSQYAEFKMIKKLCPFLVRKLCMPIEKMNSTHLLEVIDIHLESFPGFFLTFLGRRFLYVYYHGVIQYPDCIASVFIENGNVQGFVAGVMNPSGFYSALIKRDIFRFAIAAFPAFLKRPGIILRLLRAFRRPGEAPKKAYGISELTSLAVRPSAQGQGFGRDLIDAYIARVKALGGISIFLSTDAINNDSVNKFYRNRRFKLHKSYYTHENRLMNHYTFNIQQ